MVVKIVKIYLRLSLVLWAVWGHFQGGSLCLASSVCWSLQCLISTLTQWGGGGHFFFFLGSLVHLRCGEGGMLQTNNTGLCLQCLSHAGPAPAHSAHRSGSTLLCREPSEAGPRLHAPPRSKPLRLALRYPSEAQIWLGLRFVAFPGPSSSGVGEWGCCNLSPFSAAHFSGSTAGAPCQADGDCPEPQEVLVSNQACLQFGR